MSLTANAPNDRGNSRAAAVADNLRTALTGSNAAWLQAALREAESDPLTAALDAAVLASALALRAAAFLDAEMRKRDAEFMHEVAA